MACWGNNLGLVKFMLRRLLFILGFVVAGGAGNVLAQQFNAGDLGISEFRAGVLVHSIDERGPNGEILNLSRLQDVSFEILFRSPDTDFFRWIGSPRPNLGATLNLGGLESMAHLGLTWQVPIFDTPFYIEGTLGAAIHNGAFDGATFPARNLGCLVQFYEAGGIGMNVSDNMTLTLSIEHASTAKLCMPNEGLTNLGVRVGYRF